MKKGNFYEIKKVIYIDDVLTDIETGNQIITYYNLPDNVATAKAEILSTIEVEIDRGGKREGKYNAKIIKLFAIYYDHENHRFTHR